MQVILTAVYKRTDDDITLRKCSCKAECEVLTPRQSGKVKGH